MKIDRNGFLAAVAALGLMGGSMGCGGAEEPQAEPEAEMTTGDEGYNEPAEPMDDGTMDDGTMDEGGGEGTEDDLGPAVE